MAGQGALGMPNADRQHGKRQTNARPRAAGHAVRPHDHNGGTLRGRPFRTRRGMAFRMTGGRMGADDIAIA
jgi:hypothetical protein